MLNSGDQIRFCSSRDGTRIAYAMRGSGPPLLWAPHWVHHLKFASESPIWSPWLDLLSRHHALVRYDCRGCGLSDRDNLDFSFERHIEDLEAVVAAVGWERFVFFGYGSGGATGVAYVARKPEKVERLALIGSPVRGRLARAATPGDIVEAETHLKVFEIGWASDAPAYGDFIAALHMPDASADQMHAYKDLLRLTTSPATALKLLRGYWQADVYDVVRRIHCPTLVCHARLDALIPFEQGRLFASLIPGARFVPLETRNHVLLDSEPAWLQFAAALDEFLPQKPAPADFALGELTARERQILDAIAEGLSNKAIASRFGTREKTVRNQVSTILSKLGVNSRAQAIVQARDAGFGRSSR